MHALSHSYTGSKNYKIDLTDKVIIDLSQEQKIALEEDEEFYKGFKKAIGSMDKIKEITDPRRLYQLAPAQAGGLVNACKAD